MVIPGALPDGCADALYGYLKSSKFTDFEIRVKGYVFKVHRVILASNSKYFEKLLSGHWKEAANGFVELEACPTVVARALQWVYCHNTSSFRTGGSLHNMLALAQGLNAGHPYIESAFKQEMDEKPYQFAAKLYSFADQYGFPVLKAESEATFVGNMQEGDFDLNDLVVAISLVYRITSDYDDTLRKWLVFLAQKSATQLRKLQSFTDEFLINTTFALDFLTKYAAANCVWCPECKGEIQLIECQCGFSGMCGYQLCTDQNWTELKCTACDRRGHLQREVAREDQAEDDVGTQKVRDVYASPKTPTGSSTRKRKHGSS